MPDVEPSHVDGRLQIGAIAECIDRQAEDVVRFVLGNMHLEQMQPTIILLDQPHFPCQLQHHSHTAIRDAASLVRQFILYAGRIQNGSCSRYQALILIYVGLCQAFLDSPLASL
jgi:hypothetical protein